MIYKPSGEFKLELEDYEKHLKEFFKIKVLAKSEYQAKSNDPNKKHKLLPRPDFSKFFREGFDEVVWLNEKGEVCEGSYTNIFFELEDPKTGRVQLHTPSLEAGILAGTCRSRIIKKFAAIEGSYDLEGLKKAKKIYLTNAMIGLKEARL